MIRFLFLGLVACASTLGGAQLAISFSAAKPEANANSASSYSTFDIFETELLAANRLSGDHVSGYFLARFVVAMHPGSGERRLPPIKPVFIDTFHSFVSASPMFDFSQTGAIDVARIAGEMRKLVNSRFDKDVVHSVFVTQVDYLKQNEVRTNSAARRATIRGEVTGTGTSGVVGRAKH